MVKIAVKNNDLKFAKIVNVVRHTYYYFKTFLNIFFIIGKCSMPSNYKLISETSNSFESKYFVLKKHYRVFSMASKPINICWIRTISKPY